MTADATARKAVERIREIDGFWNCGYDGTVPRGFVDELLGHALTLADRLEQFDPEGKPRPGHGPGVPGAMHLEAFGQDIRMAFGAIPYHVGSSATSKTWRDVDVRLILDDDRFHALFPGFAAAHHIDAWWSLLCAALSELGRKRTGLPIDFQIQSMTEANEKYPTGIRNPLFLIHTKDSDRPALLPNTDPAAREEQTVEPADTCRPVTKETDQ